MLPCEFCANVPRGAFGTQKICAVQTPSDGCFSIILITSVAHERGTVLVVTADFFHCLQHIGHAQDEKVVFQAVYSLSSQRLLAPTRGADNNGAVGRVVLLQTFQAECVLAVETLRSSVSFEANLAGQKLVVDFGQKIDRARHHVTGKPKIILMVM